MPTITLNDVNLSAVGSLVEAVSADSQVGQTQWSADIEWKGAFRSQSQIREFDPIPSDEPAGLGGTDSAPNPVEQLLAALGNCLAVGYAANASVAGIEVRDLNVAVEGDLDLTTFLGLGGDHAGFDRITAEVHIVSDASDAQLQELHEKVVGSSPVGHTLTKAIPVAIALKGK